MSRIGKQPIQLKQGVSVEMNGSDITISGSKGSISNTVPNVISVEQEGDTLVVAPASKTKSAKEMWGLWRTLLANAVDGVSEGFSKELELVGVGYRVQTKGNAIELAVGYSHPVLYEPPEGITLEVEKGVIKVSGIDKQLVGQVAAEIRAVRSPEPYKGKGIRYVGEHVKLKPGKAAKAGM